MREYRYKLASNKVKKATCPNCGKSKRWQRYIDTVTGEIMSDEYGRCDRESNCGAHHWPRLKPTERQRIIEQQKDKIIFKFGYDTVLVQAVKKLGARWKSLEKHWELRADSITDQIKSIALLHGFTLNEYRLPRPTVYIPTDVFKKTLDHYEANTFVQNLLQHIAYPFERSDVKDICGLYGLGTVSKGYMNGACTFPFVNIERQVCAIQAKKFDRANHTTNTNWIHSIIESYCKDRSQSVPAWLEAYKLNERRVSCLFGEHLLNQYPHNTIALVEAPKTAVYGTLYFGSPDNLNNFLWLAVGALSWINESRCQVLAGRDVVLFPDLSNDGKAFKDWTDKAAKFGSRIHGSTWRVSDLIEQKAGHNARSKGLDIADYLSQYDWREFRTERTPTMSKVSKMTLQTKLFKKQSEHQDGKLAKLYAVNPHVETMVNRFELSTIN